MLDNIIQDVSSLSLSHFHKKYNKLIINIEGNYEDGVYSILQNINGRERILYIQMKSGKYFKHFFLKSL